MDFNLSSLWLPTLLLTGCLFCFSLCVRRHFIPERFVENPITYVLALGIAVGTWALLGSVSIAFETGFSYLTYFFGISIVFFLAPILLIPLQRLKKTHQMETLTDVLVYRYRSLNAGIFITFLMIIMSLPLLLLQIEALNQLLLHLQPNANTQPYLLTFLVTAGLFTAYFSTPPPKQRYKQPSLISSIAFLSVVKYGALLLLVGLSFYRIFGNFTTLQTWLIQNPSALERLYTHQEGENSYSLNLAIFTAFIALPHFFHVALSNSKANSKTLLLATWAFPVCLLLVALTIPLVIWMALKLGITLPASFFLLGISQHIFSPWGPTAVWIMVFCASFAVMSISVLDLSIMVSHYWVWPLLQPTPHAKIYRWHNGTKCTAIFLFLLSAYLLFLITQNNYAFSDFVILSITGMLHFLPGIVGTLFWPRANRQGLLVGLALGASIWFIGLALPLLLGDFLAHTLPFGLGYLFVLNHWQTPAFFAFAINVLGFLSVSITSRQSPTEMAIAQNCIVFNIRKHYRWDINWHSINDITQQLTPALGNHTAQREVKLALQQLGFTSNEQRPYALRRVRNQLETNLSTHLGPALAQRVIDKQLPYLAAAGNTEQDIYCIEQFEQSLSNNKYRFSGLASTLDQLRRFHRQTILALPLGVISLSENGEIMGWNHAMEALSQIPHEQVIGSKVRDLAAPWRHLILQLMTPPHPHKHALQETVTIAGLPHCLRLKVTNIQTHRTGKTLRGMVISIEDLTEVKQLESQLAHSERLASIGKLAAGVAHEIGNPLTAIACLSQELRSNVTTSHDRELVEALIGQIHRIRDIVQSLISFSHCGSPPTQHAVPVRVFINVEAAIQLTRLSDEGKKMHFINNVDHSLWILGDEQKLQQVLTNLLSNARDACTPGQHITLCSNESTPETAVITITDEGHGIAESIKDTLLDPFVTTKPPGKGTGLGLSLVYSIVQTFNGHIHFTSPVTPEGTGTRVTLSFPRISTTITPCDETTLTDTAGNTHSNSRTLTHKKSIKNSINNCT